MKKIHIVSLKRLRSACYRVRRELAFHGFMDDKLVAVPVYLGAVGGPYGWQNYGGDGSIVIPAVSLSKIGDLFKRRYTGLCDTLRHEMGHALSDTHRGLFRRKSFLS